MTSRKLVRITALVHGPDPMGAARAAVDRVPSPRGGDDDAAPAADEVVATSGTLSASRRAGFGARGRRQGARPRRLTGSSSADHGASVCGDRKTSGAVLTSPSDSTDGRCSSYRQRTRVEREAQLPAGVEPVDAGEGAAVGLGSVEVEVADLGEAASVAAVAIMTGAQPAA